jgi:hypothetical protein
VRQWFDEIRTRNYPVQRFSNTQEGSEPFAKFSTLLFFSAGYKSIDLIRSAWKRFVLIVEPLQFHDSPDDQVNRQDRAAARGLSLLVWEVFMIFPRFKRGIK